MSESPFPGMDPYLEAPGLWPDVHIRLMTIFSEQLIPMLAPHYLAELDTQIVIDRGDDEPLLILPDVSVTTAYGPAEAATATAAVAPAPLRLQVPLEVPTRLISMTIRHRERARLVAVIELLSPINKRRGEGRDAYLEKRRTVLHAPVHLIEIDLLRRCRRMPFDEPLPATHYLVAISQAGLRPHCDVWSISVRQPLPIIPIPLLVPDPPVPLDIGQALRTAYARARYDLRVDYRAAAQPAPGAP